MSSRASKLSVLLAAVLAALAVSASGCQPLDPQTGLPAEPSRPVVTGMQNFGAVWGKTVSGMFAVTMMVEAPQIDGQATAQVPGDVVVFCVVEIANLGQYPFDYTIQDFWLVTEGGGSMGGGDDGDLFTVTVPPLAFGSTLEPDERVRGAVAFELTPDEAKHIIELRFGHMRPSEGSWESRWSDGP